MRMIVLKLDISTVLFGSDILDHLGFRFTKHLAYNYNSVKDPEVSAKVKECSYTAVNYGNQNDAPIEPNVDLS